MIDHMMTAHILINALAASLLNWISPAEMQSLGWALLHFLWQGTALAALAAAAMALTRRPAVRYVIGLMVLALMLLAPVATVFFYSHQFYSRQAQALAPANTPSPLVTAAWPIARGYTASSAATVSTRSRSFDAFPWLVEAWLIGVALLSIRSAGGFFLLERERRRTLAVVSDEVLDICFRLQDQLGITRAIQYCESAFLQAPAVIGWFRPIVFLPVSALTGLSDEQLRMVIAHELAHIQRFDAFVNVFQICAETLLFYHPAVWWLNKRIRADRELCCDETAVSICGDAVEYARALTLMEEWRTAPALAMAANRGPLSERIMHLLGLNSRGGSTRKLGVVGSIVFLTTALVAGNALFGIAHSRPTVYASSSSAIKHFFQVQAAQPQLPATPATTPAAKPSAAQSAQRSQPSGSAESYVDGMSSAGLKGLSADDLIALKVQGVTPEYVRQMKEIGLHPNIDDLVGMKVQGVTPEYVKDLRSLGFNPDVDEIIGMKVQGVTADYVRGMREAGMKGDADQIIGMKVQGVTPEYVRDLQALGLKVDGDDIIGMKVQGVTAAYVKGLRDLGLNPDADGIVGMKVQGVTPEYIRDIRALGLNPGADDIVGMKVQGVTPEYIKALQSAGFKPDVDDVIGAKVQGVTPEFIDAARKHGFQNLTIDKLIQLKHLGILESNKGEL
ncbi:MAG TPA: M56 family metallopeptidase [Candidatus Sulfotelmatobacter sp.]|nr:M56 family metallopeptidase [Candidatus Sulfotelmatobacter sp.]